MSMPQPIKVVLICSSWEFLNKTREHFRFSTPGLGSAILCALDAPSNGRIIQPKAVPKGVVTLWLALDVDALNISRQLHGRDEKIRHYGRGFYDEIFHDACVLISYNDMKELKSNLQDWKRRIADAYYASS